MHDRGAADMQDKKILSILSPRDRAYLRPLSKFRARAISGTLLVVAGFDYPGYFTVLFGLSRAVGISRQIVYERLEARGGKGTPIVRPKYLYSGPKI